ncbi:RrF2 family transcriptional regulator [Candidatus Contubernalis alkaliaceticus]|uniref:RrF2 family transcriptional regulator n=1 Tax=Candidatus Contubernalis alkaliaceticus TaxID=338645 RepID=UPI001F4C31C3|nr:Rrf2 family transcriptional regulator [Candidatus Contubernalis alkalaceticus]UNC92860.1 Rrf2 family transcriptional regulator [Candidatus Contubernalis alkalaceticus]
MQITRQTEYAVRTLLELASVPYGQLLSTHIISEHQNIPEVFLKKTIQLLARAGLVKTQRGSQGGVGLLVVPEKITIADVLTAVEGKVALNVCLGDGDVCPNKANCGVRCILLRAQQAMIKELSRESLLDIVRGKIGN